MTIQGTRNDLYHMEQDILKMKQEQHTLSILLRKPIADFFNYNEVELKVTDGRFKSILSEYVEKDEQGKLLHHEVNGVKKWKFRSSFCNENKILVMGQDNVEAEFDRQVHKLMSQPIIIIV